MPNKILVILGHPDTNSYCGALAQSYVDNLPADSEVKFFKLGELKFDPILWHGHNQRQELEPDLQDMVEALKWADHYVMVYPIWWGSIPALLKGFFDRVFLPGITFKYRENSIWWDRLLTGKTARLIVTMDTPPWYYRLVYRMPGHNQMKITILKWCGVKPVKITSFGPIKGSSQEQREKWQQAVVRLAKTAS